MNPVVKWPLLLISFLFGVALAFFPFQERPLTTWIFSFFQSIYSPTIFNWEPTTRKVEYFQAETAAPVVQTQPAIQPSPNPNVPPVAQATTPVATELVKESPVISVQTPVTVQTVAPPVISTVVAPTVQDSSTSVQSARSEVTIPQTQTVTVPVSTKPPAELPIQEIGTPVYQSGPAVSPMTAQKSRELQPATFTPEAAPPLPPTRSNVVVGQVMDNTGKILEGAILEIRDNQGRSVRALRTNKLGHFMIVTPLLDGHYELSTEKDGYTFEPVGFEAKGEIISPIQITGKESQPTQS